MNKILTTVLLVVLSLPISVWAVDNMSTLEPINENNGIENILSEKDEEKLTTTPINTQNQYKQPTSKRKIAKKFLAAMGGVVASSLTLFILLTVYNKIRDNVKNRVKTPDGEVSLQTPDDIKNAIKTFLEITKF